MKKELTNSRKVKGAVWKKIAGTVMIVGVLLSATNATVSANSYQAYRLPINQGNNYTPVHDKTTHAKHITNEVTAITKASYANFWAINSSNKAISKKYKQGPKTGLKKLVFTSDGYGYVGAEVGMGMENNRVSTKVAFVSGNVNFK